MHEPSDEAPVPSEPPVAESPPVEKPPLPWWQGPPAPSKRVQEIADTLHHLAAALPALYEAAWEASQRSETLSAAYRAKRQEIMSGAVYQSLPEYQRQAHVDEYLYREEREAASADIEARHTNVKLAAMQERRHILETLANLYAAFPSLR